MVNVFIFLGDMAVIIVRSSGFSIQHGYVTCVAVYLRSFHTMLTTFFYYLLLLFYLLHFYLDVRVYYVQRTRYSVQIACIFINETCCLVLI